MSTLNELLGPSLVRDPFAGDAEPSPGNVERAIAEALELARRAYVAEEPDALRAAEHTLYRIHLRYRFGAPVEPLLCAVWSVLVRGAVRRWLRLYDGPAEVEPASMRPTLEAAVRELGAYRHPLLDRLDAGDRPGYLVFVKNWFGSCHGFSQQLSALSQRCQGAAKLIVLDNLRDEFDSVTHDTLRTRFIAAVGYTFDAVGALEDPDRVVESFALLNFRTALCALPEPAYALGSFYTTEANWPAECERHLKINLRRGMGPDALAYWTTHATADTGHASDWMSALESTYRDPLSCGRVVRGAIAQLRLRRRMYDAMLARIEGGDA
jgi:pyrroloquinoline quinone (PQQ) biosynthesis protein C